MAVSTKKVIASVAALAVAAFLVWGLMQSATPPRTPLQGQIEAQEINVSSKVPGRVGKIDVQLGQSVKQGDVLFELDSPEVQAKVAQAKAAQEAVQATYSKAQAGARPEEIAMARYNWERAQTGARIAHATYQRVQAMYKEGVIAQQKRDEAEAQWRAAEQLAQAARAQYDMAQHGARPEDKRAAEAQTRQVAGVVAEAQVALAETQIKSPGNGEINKISIQAGELAPQGFPVVTIVNLADTWAVVTVREDELKPYAVGTAHTGHVPALRADVPFTVSFVSAMPDFATWKAARPGGTDLRTFEVRLRPAKAVEGLRPGMSIVFPAD
ncbi:MAG TPA: biotin/lipoyl-binding protein [Noviherbaspirillum sp.]|uniref:HlyD family secretion protein n=1 Tax=Noviherbaspirillum sp. TaxID=1926288 RepID=UPI002B48B3A9|nr:biotin/lipoyl-binding protein [Noviherbaspirillum sp.]HJV84490.1 biotin/lipoyl-binding protein [Noviherbaspirillum sp.]